MRRFLRVFAALTLLVIAGVAEAHCRETDPVLEATADLARFVANLRNAVEHVAAGTPADEDLGVLRQRVEAFYDQVDQGHASCSRLRRDFALIAHLGDVSVAQIEAQGLMQDSDVSGRTIGMRLALLNAKARVDDL